MPATEHNSVPYALPFRTAFTTGLELTEATSRVREQLRSWFKGKQLDVGRFDARESTIGPGISLRYVEVNDASGWQLRERRAGETWVSTVSVTRDDKPDTTWISLNVEAVTRDGPAPRPAPPKLVRLLLDAIEAWDGDARLTSRPIVVTSESQVEELLEVVCDPGRRLPTVLATTPIGADFSAWQRTVVGLTADLPGIASMHLLSPEATRQFNEGIGPTHYVGAGAIRTYLPEVDPAVAEDAVRHRVLGRRRIEAEPWRARRALAALPRQRAANSLPARAARGLELTLRDLTAERRTRDTADAGALRAEVDELREVLDVAQSNEAQLNARIDRLQEELLDAASELEVAQREVERHSGAVRALQRRLVKAKLHTEAYMPVEEQVELPLFFADLLDRWETELAPYVRFTGDRGVCLDLDDQQQSSTWAQTAWQGLLALRDYAKVKQDDGFPGDFKRWCEQPPDGQRAISAGKVVRGESETVRNHPKFSAARTLPVPIAVEPTGQVFMREHLKLGQSSSVAPRMYYYDATASHGVVYVGYIGRHLENTLTS